MRVVISLVAIAITLSSVSINILLSRRRGEKIFPSKDQLRRSLKLMITGRYEPPKRVSAT